MQTDIHKQTSIRAFLNTYMHIRTQQSCSSFLQSESQVLEHEFECMYCASMKTMRIQHLLLTKIYICSIFTFSDISFSGIFYLTCIFRGRHYTYTHKRAQLNTQTHKRTHTHTHKNKCTPKNLHQRTHTNPHTHTHTHTQVLDEEFQYETALALLVAKQPGD